MSTPNSPLDSLGIERKRRRRWPWITGIVVVALAVAGTITGVNIAAAQTKTFGTKLTVATWSTDIAAQEVLDYVSKNVAPKYGITIVDKHIDNLVEINRAVDSGDIAANLFEHQPFLNDAVAANGFHLEQPAKVFTWDQATYSSKYKTWDAIPDGAKIGLRDDPAGQAIALLDLVKSGQITLKAGHDTLADLPQLDDIATNPKHFQFVQIPIGQLARSFTDVDAIVVHISDVYAAGLPDSDIIDRPAAPKGSESGLTVSTRYEKDANIQKLIQAFKDPAIQTYLKTTDDKLVKDTLGPLDAAQ